MKKIFYEVDDFSHFNGEVQHINKGLKILFSDKLVIKQYNLRPKNMTFDDRNNRFFNELKAYLILIEKKCPFIATLIDYSEEKKIISLERIEGMSIREILDKNIDFDIQSTINQIKAMNLWFKENNINGINSHNIKDLIFNKDLTKLYLVDFEQYNENLSKSNFYANIIEDYLDRILKIRNRKINYHSKSIKFFFRLLNLNYLSLFNYFYRLPLKII